MGKEESLKKLKELKEWGMKNKEIEQRFGLTKNSLSNILSGKVSVPKRAFEKIENYKDGVDLPKDYVEVKKIGVIMPNGEVKDITEIDHEIPEWATTHQLVLSEIKHIPASKREICAAVAEQVHEEKTESVNKIPQTLEEVKALCPPELKGMERSEWISQNRVKYNV